MTSDVIQLSDEGKEFLSDAVIYTALSAIVEPLGITPREYLERFEKMLSENPSEILKAFGKT